MNESGHTLVEMLVAMLIAVVVAGLSMGLISFTSTINSDNELIVKTEEKARSVLDMIIFDLRMAGAGMPLGQSDFTTEDSTLGNAPLPFYSDSTASSLHFRRNETGYSAMLTALFNPEDSLTVYLTSTADIVDGDTIYISDAIAGGHDGLRGTVNSVAADSITLDPDYVASADAQFPSGSELNRVVEITYSSPEDGSGVTRDNGTNNVIMATLTEMNVSYLDQNGVSLGATLSQSEIEDDLSKISVTVTARSTRPLSKGGIYMATASELVTLRNLVINR